MIYFIPKMNFLGLGFRKLEYYTQTVKEPDKSSRG